MKKKEDALLLDCLKDIEHYVHLLEAQNEGLKEKIKELETELKKETIPTEIMQLRAI